MNILITGSNGFIGKNLTEFLIKDQKFKLSLLSSKQIKQQYINDNIDYHYYPSESGELENLIHEIKPKVLIHLAWKGIPNYEIQNSLDSAILSIHICKAALSAGTKQIISTGSCWEYMNPKGSIKENWPKSTDNYFKSSINLEAKIPK